MTAKDINTELTYELAHEFLEADFKAGILIWKKRDKKHFKSLQAYNMWNTRYADKKTNRINTHLITGKKYNQITIFGKTYGIHRILFFMYHNYWPLHTDHIDGNSLNNNINNLRSVTRRENHKNKRLNKNNTTKCCGVYWHKQRKKWQASIGVNDILKYIGLYADFFEAVCARKSAENKHGFHPNHGSDKPL